MKARYGLAHLKADLTVQVTMTIEEWREIGGLEFSQDVEEQRAFGNAPEPLRTFIKLAATVAHDVLSKTSGWRDATPYGAADGKDE